jgi:phage-related protein
MYFTVSRKKTQKTSKTGADLAEKR